MRASIHGDRPVIPVGYLASEVCRPRQRWSSWVMRAALRLSIGAACAVAGAQWATAVQVRRERVIIEYRPDPVPEMCEARDGLWRRCPWIVGTPTIGD